MALDNIFALFNFPDENNEDRKKLESELEVFKETPHFKLGMFHKLIMNGNVFSKQVVKFFAKSDPALDLKEINYAGEYMMYTRAWFWVEQVEFKKKEWKEAIKQYASDDFLISIKLSINYFEDTEEYERCAHLKKLQDLVQKSLAK
jgi:hypothetical protein